MAADNVCSSLDIVAELRVCSVELEITSDEVIVDEKALLV
jgi:hypothetical protein